ncbi:osmoprotectant transport system permease protein [Mumia flava]|uniref:Osmoprotectant transport system permease protein n=1 Tax=Mumia flava TaxID=1348852 RepID=A0A0B2BQZ1_9ACTN|nr:ABC transporter permease [Mumia flava]PJJ58106.1 osmoprotectant transport system permease protein [Mumia flava]
MTVAAFGAALSTATDTGPPCYARTVNDWLCWDYVVDYAPELREATVQHIALTAASVVLGLVLALVLAIAARNRPRWRAALLSGTTIVYTIPSLALFALLVPWTGLSAATVVVGLGLYSLSILVRNVLAGLDGVPDEVHEAARGLGYSTTRMLARIEMPIAVPVIVAGLRVATVSTVAMVTLGTIVSYGGLGNMLATGIDDTFKAQVLTTSVLCVLLAVVFDLVVVGVGWLLTPWSRRSS